MNKIEELLKNEKVEWKRLGDVAEMKRGQSITKSRVKQGKVPVIAGGQVPAYFHNESNRGPNTIAIAGSGAYAGFVSYWQEPIFLSDAFSVEPNKSLNRKYLYYFLLNKQNRIYQFQKGAGIPHVYGSDVATLEIPIPSLKTQEKIVKTLDKFTNYVAELQAELQVRGKQYEYYRDELLSEDNLKIMSKKFGNFEGEDKILKTVELEDVAKIRNGKDWKTLGKGSIPVYGSGGKMDKYVDKYSYNKPTVLIPRKGSIQNVFYLEEAFWNVDTIFYTEINDQKILPKYLFYFIENYDVSSLSTDSTRPSLTQSILNKIKLTLPSISVQNKIVQILDKFQNLVSQTQGLLPEEIEQRQKQYEYYREKLLTFDLDSDIITRQTDRQ